METSLLLELLMLPYVTMPRSRDVGTSIKVVLFPFFFGVMSCVGTNCGWAPKTIGGKYPPNWRNTKIVSMKAPRKHKNHKGTFGIHCNAQQLCIQYPINYSYRGICRRDPTTPSTICVMMYFNLSIHVVNLYYSCNHYV